MINHSEKPYLSIFKFNVISATNWSSFDSVAFNLPVGQVMHDPYYPRDYYKNGSKTIPFDGDGSISAFRIKNGNCAFKQRYVLTERFLAERQAGRAMFGILKTPFSHHPCVRAVQDNTANTNVIVHAGKLLALSEQGPPYELDPSKSPSRQTASFQLAHLEKWPRPRYD